MQLQEYLAVNRSALDATVTALADQLITEEDTDRDRRAIARNTYKALQSALKNLLSKVYKEGRFWGVSGDVFVTIHQPVAAQDLLGQFIVHAGRLHQDSMIPCPDDWPRSGSTLSPFVQSLIGAISQPRSAARVLTTSSEGAADLGMLFADRQYVIEELPEGELWWKPLDGILEGE